MRSPRCPLGRQFGSLAVLQTTSRYLPCKDNTFRLLQLGMGGGYYGKERGSGTLENPGLLIHKHKGITSCISQHKEFGKGWETFSLAVDNSVAYSYLRREGENPTSTCKCNLWNWCMNHDIRLQTIFVPSKDCLADSLSRTPLDRGDYTLNNQTFKKICSYFKHCLVPSSEVWDMFSSPGNHKFQKKFNAPTLAGSKTGCLSLYPNRQKICYANLPWSCKAQWLHLLWENPA